MEVGLAVNENKTKYMTSARSGHKIQNVVEL